MRYNSFKNNEVHFFKYDTMIYDIIKKSFFSLSKSILQLLIHNICN